MQVLLMSAGLLAAPASAVAGPSPDTKGTQPDDQVEHFEWSMSMGRARLGVMAMSLTPELRTYFGAPSDRGVLIGRVQPDSAAAAAGLQVGDVLVQVKGDTVDDATDVIDSLSSAKKGERVDLSVIRDKRAMRLSAKMTDDPAPATSFDRAPFKEWPKWLDDWFEDMPRPWAPQHHHDT
jgi:C-terminal processing protease CtpA/Prc